MLKRVWELWRNWRTGEGAGKRRRNEGVLLRQGGIYCAFQGYCAELDELARQGRPSWVESKRKADGDTDTCCPAVVRSPVPACDLRLAFARLAGVCLRMNSDGSFSTGSRRSDVSVDSEGRSLPRPIPLVLGRAVT